jgi:hypothetical protein
MAKQAGKGKAEAANVPNVRGNEPCSATDPISNERAGSVGRSLLLGLRPDMVFLGADTRLRSTTADIGYC